MFVELGTMALVCGLLKKMQIRCLSTTAICAPLDQYFS